MTTSIARITTDRASRYLQQLCKHFGHKVPAEFSASEGHVNFPFGSCDMQVDQEQLVLTVKATDGDLGRLEKFIGSHLERFAFRERPEIKWQREAS